MNNCEERKDSSGDAKEQESQNQADSTTQDLKVVHKDSHETQGKSDSYFQTIHWFN